MPASSLILFMVLGQAPAPDPAAQVSQLGSAKYSKREAASAELERLGRVALPALRHAVESKDPEIRNRAMLLVSRIEGAVLTQPSSIRLGFKNATVQEILKSVGEQSGVKLVLRPENSPAFRDRRLSLDQSEPVTFWKALDLIADKARLQYNYGPHGSTGGREAEFPLFDGGSRPFLPSFDSGPFRVIVSGLHFQRDLSFTGGQLTNPSRFAQEPNASVGSVKGTFPAMLQENFNALIQIVGEPRFSIGQIGPIRITEARDEKGQSLVVPVESNPAINSEVFQRSSGYLGYASGSVLQVQAQLIRPPSPGSVIKSLKGSVPVALSTRKPNPLTASLKTGIGRMFQNEETILTLHEVRTNPESRQTNIEVSIRPQRKANASNSPGLGTDSIATNRPDLIQQQIDVVDRLGRPIMWYPTQFDGESGRITLAVAPVDLSTAPVEVRYHSIARATTDVTFEFHDLPMP